jgi:hypothetical protein
VQRASERDNKALLPPYHHHRDTSSKKPHLRIALAAIVVCLLLWWPAHWYMGMEKRERDPGIHFLCFLRRWLPLPSASPPFLFSLPSSLFFFCVSPRLPLLHLSALLFCFVGSSPPSPSIMSPTPTGRVLRCPPPLSFLSRQQEVLHRVGTRRIQSHWDDGKREIPFTNSVISLHFL